MTAPTSQPGATSQDPAAYAELVTTTRALMVDVGLADVDAATMTEATRLMEQAAALLSTHQRERCYRPHRNLARGRIAVGHQATMDVYNPQSVPVEITYGEGSVSATLVAGALLEGPPESVHGGISAWLMDMLLGAVVRGEGARAVTGTLNMRYLARTPLDQELNLGAELVKHDGRKITVRGWIDHRGQRCVEATGLFIEVAG